MTLQEFRIPTAVKRHVVFFVGTLSFNHTSSYFLDFASVIVLSETVCELAVIVGGLWLTSYTRTGVNIVDEEIFSEHCDLFEWIKY